MPPLFRWFFFIINFIFFRHRNALLLALNAFCNVRLAPLQNMTLKHVKSAFVEEDKTTLLILGRHKTGQKCSINLPNKIFDQLKIFCERLRNEQDAKSESPVHFLFLLI